MNPVLLMAAAGHFASPGGWVPPPPDWEEIAMVFLGGAICIIGLVFAVSYFLS